MKALKMFMVVLIAVAFIMPLTVSDSQAAAWYTCYVNRCGQGTAGGSVMLSDTAVPATFTNTYYNLSSTGLNAMISTGLTAMASGMKVYAYINGSTCQAMLLLDQ